MLRFPCLVKVFKWNLIPCRESYAAIFIYLLFYPKCLTLPCRSADTEDVKYGFVGLFKPLIFSSVREGFTSESVGPLGMVWLCVLSAVSCIKGLEDRLQKEQYGQLRWRACPCPRAHDICFSPDAVKAAQRRLCGGHSHFNQVGCSWVQTAVNSEPLVSVGGRGEGPTSFRPSGPPVPS